MLIVDNLRVDQTNKNRITRLKRKLVDIGLPKPSIGQDWIKARSPKLYTTTGFVRFFLLIATLKKFGISFGSSKIEIRKTGERNTSDSVWRVAQVIIWCHS